MVGRFGRRSFSLDGASHCITAEAWSPHFPSPRSFIGAVGPESGRGFRSLAQGKPVAGWTPGTKLLESGWSFTSPCHVSRKVFMCFFSHFFAGATFLTFPKLDIGVLSISLGWHTEWHPVWSGSREHYEAIRRDAARLHPVLGCACSVPATPVGFHWLIIYLFFLAYISQE